MKRNNLKQIMRLYIIPALLLGVWVVLSLFFNNSFSFSVITYPHAKDSIVSHAPHTLLQGQKIQGKFTAHDNHLGLVLLKFNSYIKYDFNGEDILVFRIREKGSQTWFHTSTFKAGILRNQLNFPFGFPIIGDAKGKQYEFELESLYGNQKNGITLNAQNPSLASGYQIPKEEITASKKNMLTFLGKKLISSFTNIDFLLSSLIYLIPFLVFVFSTSKRVNVAVFRKYYAVCFSILLFAELFIIKEFNTGLLLILILAWVYVIQLYKLKSTINFIFAFSFLGVWILLIPFGMDNMQGKLNIWVYVFLVFGTIQAISEELKREKKKLSFPIWLKKIKN